MYSKTYFTKIIYALVILSCFSFNAYTQITKDTLVKRKWLLLNIDAALIANNGLSNLTNAERNAQNQNNGYNYQNSDVYSAIKSTPVCFGLSAGIEFLLGKNDRFKHLVAFNYDLTNSYFNEIYSSSYRQLSGGSYSDGNINTNRQVQFLGVNYGVLIKLSKHFNFAAIACYSYMLKNQNIINGYHEEGYAYGGGGQLFGSGYEKVEINNEKTKLKTDTGVVSIKFRLGYDFKIKSQHFAIYALRNFAITNFYVTNNNQTYAKTAYTQNYPYKAPWWMIGVQFYPFKNAR
jgi:hypothetical protein